jgi:hypothetical protein
LLADIGDNTVTRKDYCLYLIEEPVIEPATNTLSIPLTCAWKIPFTFPDGAHNCEAVAVDPLDGSVLIMTKRWTHPCTVYQLRIGDPARKMNRVARTIVSMNLFAVTAADCSPDGRRLLLATYGDAYEFTRGPREKWPAVLIRTPAQIALPPRRQGESACYGPDGLTIYLTSEKQPTPLWEVRLVPEP